MRRARSLAVLAGVTLAVVIAAAAVKVRTGGGAIPGEGELTFPGLLPRVDEVRRIRAVTGGETFTLAHDGTQWTMAERDGYRVLADKVHKLVVGAAGLERLEPKTADPALYPRLGLGDPSQSGTGSIRFTLQDEEGEVLADFIVGNREPSRIDLAWSEFYLREPDEARSWLVEGKLSVSRDPVEWLDRQVLHIDPVRVRAVHVRQPGGGGLDVARSRPQDDDFVLDNAPPGHEVEDQWRINDVGRGLAQLRFDDVRSAAGREGRESPGFTAELVTFDGLRVRVNTYREAGATWFRLSAVFDEEAIDPRFISAGPGGGGDEAGAEGGGTGAAGAEPVEGLLAAPAVREEARRLNALREGWEYRLADYKNAYFTAPVAELVKPIRTERES